MGFFGWLNWFFRDRCRYADECPHFERSGFYCTCDYQAKTICGLHLKKSRVLGKYPTPCKQHTKKGSETNSTKYIEPVSKRSQKNKKGMIAELLLLTLFSGVFVAGMFPHSPAPDYEAIPLTLSCERLECVQEPELDFLQALEKVSSAKNWTRGVYMCGNFSRAYISTVQELGYSARYVTGKISPGDGRHAWVELLLYIDPTAGVLVKPNETYYVEDEW